MGLTEVCIKRPVFSTVLTLLIVIIGLVCQWQLPVRKDPKIEKSIKKFYVLVVVIFGRLN